MCEPVYISRILPAVMRGIAKRMRRSRNMTQTDAADGTVATAVTVDNAEIPTGPSMLRPLGPSLRG
ncbi:MAG TPA: hypothetical protein DIU00_03435 [Phycisphaerales bacterium]|nr:hypothetical protein [Phycisphaerales bacterium]